MSTHSHFEQKSKIFGDAENCISGFDFLFLKMTGQLGKYYGLKNRTTDYHKKTLEIWYYFVLFHVLLQNR